MLTGGQACGICIALNRLSSHSLSLTFSLSFLSSPSAEALKRKEKMQALISRVTSAQSKGAVNASESGETTDDTVAAQLDTLSLGQVASEEDRAAATSGDAVSQGAAAGDVETAEQATEAEEGDAQLEPENDSDNEDEGSGQADGNEANDHT